MTRTARAFAAAAAVLVVATVPAAAAGLRSISSVTVDTYFGGTWLVTSEEVLLARVAPAFSVEGRYLRMDRAGASQNTFFLGPVVNFTDIMYGELVYGLGIDFTGAIFHTVDANLDFETPLAAASLGVRGYWFPSTPYWYLLPSVGGTFHPAPPVGVLGKLFVSYDANGLLTASFWGEASVALSARFTVRAGFTASYAGAFGYSLIGGLGVAFSENVQARYSCSYLADTVEYLDQPVRRDGIENALVLDVKL